MLFTIAGTAQTTLTILHINDTTPHFLRLVRGLTLLKALKAASLAQLLLLGLQNLLNQMF